MESPVAASPTGDRDSAAADQPPHLASPSMSVEMQAMQQAPRPASGNNRVHPAPAPAASSGNSGGDSLAVPVTGGAHARGRSSVFFGRPDEAMIAAAEAAADSDEEEEEDEAVARSAFHRQRSIVTTAAGSGHRVELLVATFNLLVHLGTILTDLMLLSDYSQNGQNVSAAALAIIRVLVGLVEIQFDYLNRGWKNGRWIFIPLIFCNGRILLEYHAYLRAWARHRRVPWSSSDFRAAVSFETLIGSLPSLIVQTYVVISDPRPVQQVWVVALAMTAVSASVDLLHHYKYVSVESSIYLAQFLKAVVSTGMRTVLVAVLLDVIGRVTLAWAIVSFLFGCVVYYAAVRWARSRERDDPFQYGSVVAHYAFGGLVAATQLFVSIPFAPSHSIYDWWLGYLLCEAKMAVENFCMLAVVLVHVAADYRADLFYSVAGFTVVCYVGNLFACWFIHQRVRRQLNARNLYSTTAIVSLFAHFLHYYKIAWHPESIPSHGGAQSHLLYKDRAGKVPAHLSTHYQMQVQRTATVNQQAAMPAPAPTGEAAARDNFAF